MSLKIYRITFYQNGYRERDTYMTVLATSKEEAKRFAMNTCSKHALDKFNECIITEM